MEVIIEGRVISLTNHGRKIIILADEFEEIADAVEQNMRRQEVVNRLMDMVNRGDCSKSVLNDKDLIGMILDEYEYELTDAAEWVAEKHATALDRAIESCCSRIYDSLDDEAEEDAE